MDKLMREQTELNSAGRNGSNPLRILILEDNPRDVELCIQELKKAGLIVASDKNPDAFRAVKMGSAVA